MAYSHGMYLHMVRLSSSWSSKFFGLSETHNIFSYVVTNPTLIPHNAELNLAGCQGRA